jgi:hypothetical protein
MDEYFKYSYTYGTGLAQSVQLLRYIKDTRGIWPWANRVEA